MAQYEIPRSDVQTHLATLYNSAVLIDSTHAIVAHQGTSADGFIQTISWDAKFDNITVVNTLEHDTADITYSSLIKIDATHYALVYADALLDGWIKTFSIDGSYVITQVDAFEFDTTDGIWASMVLIDATHAIAAYGGPDADGFLKSFSWDAGTADNITLVDTLEHDTTGPVTHNSLELIDATHVALAYHGVSGDGILKTFSFTATGDTITQIDSLIHDAAGANWNSLVLIDATHLALAYTRPANFGYMKTFSIDAGADTITEIDALNYEAINGNGNSLVLIDTGVDGSNFVLAFNRGTPGHIMTFSIDASYDTITEIDEWIHDTAGDSYNSLIKIDDTHYFLAYSGAANLGTLKTIPVFGAEPAAPADPVVCSGGYAGGPNWSF